VLIGYFAGGSYRRIAAVTGPAGLVLVVLLVLISAVTAAARWAYVEKALVERGARAILFGRLVGVLRAVMPMAAGMARMPFRTFATYAAVGGLIWGPGSVLIGYFAGGSYQKITAVTGPAGLVLVTLLVLIGAVTATARWIAKHPERLRALIGRVIDRPRILGLRRRYRRELSFVARRFTPGGALGLSLTVGLVVIGLAGWAFGSILSDVRHKDELATRDSPVAAWLVGHRTGWLTAVMREVTTLGTGRVVAVLLVLAGLLLARKGRRWATAVMLALVAAGTSVLVDAIKLLTTRTRPAIVDLLTAAPGYAFPSGHSAQAAATYGVIAYLLAGRLRRWGHRVTVWAVAVLVIALVGFSRLYLGAHWLTDVLGGFALGAAWTALVITTFGILMRPAAPRANATASPPKEPVTTPSTAPDQPEPRAGDDLAVSPAMEGVAWRADPPNSVSRGAVHGAFTSGTSTMTSPRRRTIVPTSPPSTPRLALPPARADRAVLDGGWWPRSRDPADELPGLVLALADRYGPIRRLMLSKIAWDGDFRRLVVGTQSVRTGWFTTLDPAVAIATTDNGDQIDLLVVPPQTSDAVAHRAMAMAADPANNMRAPDVLAAASAAPSRTRNSAADSTPEWDNEGGHLIEAPAGRRALADHHQQATIRR
jgi:undecaprenyl-diphosphatase